MRHFLLRGILIGGSMGVLYALAGLTLAIRQRKRKDRK